MKTVGIIGGGIVGLCSAWYLQAAGFEVTVVDKGDFKTGCSYGNAGMIVPSHIVPLAAPGALLKGLKWLLNPQSPFAIQPGFDLEIFRWLYSFYCSANKKKVALAIPHLAKISLLSKSLYQQLSLEPALDFQLNEQGILMLYQKEKTGEAEHKLAEMANSLGIAAQILSKEALAKMDSIITYQVKGAVYFPGDAHINPTQFLRTLKAALIRKGVHLVGNKTVDQFQVEGKKVRAISSDKDRLSFDHYVVCCGAWTGELMKQIPAKIPVVAGKGYSFMIPNEIGLRFPSLLLDHKVSVTPIGNQIRFGGTMEIGSRSHKINKSRVKGIVGAIPQYYPQLKVKMPEKTDIWHGFRPCSPDGLPFIGKVDGFDNLTVATGHGMMGLSLAPATGKLLSQMIAGQKPDIDLSAFKVSRFA